MNFGLGYFGNQYKIRYDDAIAGPLAAQSLSQVLDFMGHSTIQSQWIYPSLLVNLRNWFCVVAALNIATMSSCSFIAMVAEVAVVWESVGVGFCALQWAAMSLTELNCSNLFPKVIIVVLNSCNVNDPLEYLSPIIGKFSNKIANWNKFSNYCSLRAILVEPFQAV